MWAIWIKKFGGWIAAFFSALIAIAAFVFSVRSKAKSDAAVKYTNEKAADREALAVRNVIETREAAKVETETLQEVNHVKDQISAAADSDVDKRLRDEWSRD